MPRRGFSQVEILVTMAVIGLAFLVLTTGMRNISAGITLSHKKSVAMRIAREKIETIKSLPYNSIKSLQLKAANHPLGFQYDPAWLVETIRVGKIDYKRYVCVRRLTMDAATRLTDITNKVTTMGGQVLTAYSVDAGLREVNVFVTYDTVFGARYVSLRSLVQNPARPLKSSQIQGNVRSTNGYALSNAKVYLLENASVAAFTNALGNYVLSVPEGSWNLVAAASLHQTNMTPISIERAENATQDIVLTAQATGRLGATVWVNNRILLSRYVPYYHYDDGAGNISNYEWLELFNPSNSPLELKPTTLLIATPGEDKCDIKMVYTTTTFDGTSVTATLYRKIAAPSTTVPPRSFFLISNSIHNNIFPALTMQPVRLDNNPLNQVQPNAVFLSAYRWSFTATPSAGYPIYQASGLIPEWWTPNPPSPPLIDPPNLASWPPAVRDILNTSTSTWNYLSGASPRSNALDPNEKWWAQVEIHNYMVMNYRYSFSDNRRVESEDVSAFQFFPGLPPLPSPVPTSGMQQIRPAAPVGGSPIVRPYFQRVVSTSPYQAPDGTPLTLNEWNFGPAYHFQDRDDLNFYVGDVTAPPQYIRPRNLAWAGGPFPPQKILSGEVSLFMHMEDKCSLAVEDPSSYPGKVRAYDSSTPLTFFPNSARPNNAFIRSGKQLFQNSSTRPYPYGWVDIVQQGVWPVQGFFADTVSSTPVRALGTSGSTGQRWIGQTSVPISSTVTTFTTFFVNQATTSHYFTGILSNPSLEPIADISVEYGSSVTDDHWNTVISTKSTSTNINGKFFGTLDLPSTILGNPTEYRNWVLFNYGFWGFPAKPLYKSDRFPYDNANKQWGLDGGFWQANFWWSPAIYSKGVAQNTVLPNPLILHYSSLVKGKVVIENGQPAPLRVVRVLSDNANVEVESQYTNIAGDFEIYLTTATDLRLVVELKKYESIIKDPGTLFDPFVNLPVTTLWNTNVGTLKIINAASTIEGKITQGGVPIETGVALFASTDTLNFIPGSVPPIDRGFRATHPCIYFGVSNANGDYQITVPPSQIYGPSKPPYTVTAFYTPLTESGVGAPLTPVSATQVINPGKNVINLSFP